MTCVKNATKVKQKVDRIRTNINTYYVFASGNRLQNHHMGLENNVCKAGTVLAIQWSSIFHILGMHLQPAWLLSGENLLLEATPRYCNCSIWKQRPQQMAVDQKLDTNITNLVMLSIAIIRSWGQKSWAIAKCATATRFLVSVLCRYLLKLYHFTN